MASLWRSGEPSLILLIDNYDSFTYNLYQQVSRLGGDVKVVKNDAITVAAIQALKPEKIIISPGPRTPTDAGISVAVIQHFHTVLPILGICLGHQCLAAAFGSKIIPAQQLIFGKTTPVIRTQSKILNGLPDQFEAARYHSLVIEEAPEDFVVSSRDQWGDIMSMEHGDLPLFGIQFHPESFLMLPQGDIMIKNFLKI